MTLNVNPLAAQKNIVNFSIMATVQAHIRLNIRITV